MWFPATRMRWIASDEGGLLEGKLELDQEAGVDA